MAAVGRVIVQGTDLRLPVTHWADTVQVGGEVAA